MTTQVCVRNLGYYCDYTPIVSTPWGAFKVAACGIAVAGAVVTKVACAALWKVYPLPKVDAKASLVSDWSMVHVRRGFWAVIPIYGNLHLYRNDQSRYVGPFAHEKNA